MCGRRRSSVAGIALGEALEANAASSRLRALSLRNNSLGDGAAAAFGRALAAQGACGNSHGLLSLDLSGNRSIGRGGAQALAAGVRAAGGWLRRVAFVTQWQGETRFPEYDDGRRVLLEAAREWRRQAGGGEHAAANVAAPPQLRRKLRGLRRRMPHGNGLVIGESDSESDAGSCGPDTSDSEEEDEGGDANDFEIV